MQLHIIKFLEKNPKNSEILVGIGAAFWRRKFQKVFISFAGIGIYNTSPEAWIYWRKLI
jgi:hypothetical protein